MGRGNQMDKRDLIEYLKSKEDKIAEIIESCMEWTNGWYTDNYKNCTKETANKIIEHLKISIKSSTAFKPITSQEKKKC